MHIAEVLPNNRLLFCYNYLRRNCGISPHKCGWGFLPDTNDHSLAACIDRIMVQRNAIAASMKCGISDSNFHEIWRKLRDDIIEIEKQVIGGNAYVQRVHDLFSMPINQVLAVKYVGKRKHVLCSSYCYHIIARINKTNLRYSVDLSCLNPLLPHPLYSPLLVCSVLKHFSSQKLKAQVNISDRLFSVLRPYVYPYAFTLHRKRFKCSSSL